jgi:hypothetical protein
MSGLALIAVHYAGLTPMQRWGLSMARSIPSIATRLAEDNEIMKSMVYRRSVVRVGLPPLARRALRKG